MKNYRNLIRHVKFQITNTMHCTSIYTCIMTIISNFWITFIFLANFSRIFLLRIDMILILLLLTITCFSFQNQLYIVLRVLLKNHKTFSYSLFHDIKYACFLYDKIAKFLTLNIHKEYSHLFWLLKIFLDYLHIHLFF